MRSGSGTPPLLFVHGFACSHEDWRRQIEFFESTHEVVACDLRGHGATPGRPHECSIEHYGGDVFALSSNLQLPPAVLVGHSMGCRVVLEAARLDPERVAGLVLIDGSRQASGDPDAAEAAMHASIDAAGFPAFLDNVFRQMFFQWTPQAELLLSRASKLPPDVGAALWTRMVRWDAAHLDEALAAVHVPLMVIQSTYIDHLGQRRSLTARQSTPWLELVREKVPAARIEVIPGVGHFIQLDAADEVNRLLASFP